MKIIKKFYELVDLLELILKEIQEYRKDFNMYVYNLNQVYRR